jgi:hypothetical protein
MRTLVVVAILIAGLTSAVSAQVTAKGEVSVNIPSSPTRAEIEHEFTWGP